MALKLKITKAEHDALPDAIKAEYKADGDTFALIVEGYEDPVELKRAKDREAQTARDEKKRADALQVELDKIKSQDPNDPMVKARKDGDIAVLEASWGEKLTKAQKEGQEAIDKLRNAFTATLVDGTAESLAARISTTPSVLLPHIKARLAADFEGDTPVTRVLDKAGKPSALTVAELEQEFVANPDFAAIITGSKASGGGANGGKQGGGGGATKKLAEMTGAERAAYKERDPSGYQREVEAVKAASPVKL